MINYKEQIEVAESADELYCVAMSMTESMFTKLEALKGLPPKAGWYVFDCSNNPILVKMVPSGFLLVDESSRCCAGDFIGGTWYKLPPLKDMINEVKS